MTQLNEAHAKFLSDQAVDVALAEKLGVRTVSQRSDMVALGDSNWENYANFPAILFPWTSPDGVVMYQARPDNPSTDQKSGKPRKYVFGRDAEPVLWAVHTVPNPKTVAIIEGTKQCLAGASYPPEDTSIYGIAGCRMWQVNGAPIPDLGVVDGVDVVVILDADAGTNPDVYEAGVSLAEALSMEGANKVTFGRFPGGSGKSGLDDILASRPENRRAAYMARLISGAKPKPADKAPRRQKVTGKATPKGEGDRSMIIVNDDRYVVINQLTEALLAKWNAKELFSHGGVISRRIGDLMMPVDKGSFNDLVQATVQTATKAEGAQGEVFTFAWPDAMTMAAVTSRSSSYATLDRLAHSPFVRPDGSIVTEPGYDEITRTLLMPDDVLSDLDVPKSPTPDEVTAARTLLLDEWLGDFPLDSDADRANLLGLLVTPAIRGIVPRAPMAVVDGLQMGVGKNLLADSIITVYTGHAAQPMNWVDDGEELRKQITSAFRTGAEFFVFDEAHTLQGAPLAQALTAETWQDRILGVSTMANFPNRVTWMSLGNNVVVKGDITRRVYRIALRPKYANPQDRRAETFRHPGQSGLDLGSWTRKNRRELLTAILTLIRAWFAAGSPYPKRGVSFGSFEAWERMVGGIVETAGLPGFLDNLKVWRSESDFDTQYWISHLAWLKETFKDTQFKTSDVKTKALTVGLDQYAAPPRLDDPTEKTYGKALGEAYGRIHSRRYGSYWLERAGIAHGHVRVYRVYEDADLPPAPPVRKPDPEPTPGPVDIDVSKTIQGEITMGFPLTDQNKAAVDTLVNHPHVVDEPVENQWDGKLGCSLHGGVAQGTADGDSLWIYCAPDVCGHAARPRPESDVATFDLETGDADDLYRAMGSEYVRIGAVAHDDQPVQSFGGAEVAEDVAVNILGAKTITGHNIMAFDFPALVRAGVTTMPEVHALADQGRIFDALLAARFLDPPMARDKGVDASRKYDLGAMGEKYGLGEKLSDVSKPLAKKYGGWGSIPVNTTDPDPERAKDAADFIGYMNQDVELSRSLHARLLEELGGTVPEYLVREHRVAALGAQISINGFLVDQTLLSQRVSEIERRKALSMATLSSEYGMPTHDAKGNAYKSPLASKVGKEALESALVDAGVPAKALWRTAKSGDLQVSADAMLHYGREYHNRPGVVAIAKAVYRIVSARTVYETIQNSLMPDGRVHPKVAFRQATGRWSLTEPGLTVMGKRGGRHVERAVLLPDPGEVLISADLSQVDMRAVAGLSQDQAYIEMLKQEDPHTELAIALFGGAQFREQAKAIGHGWNYGESLRRISEGNEIDMRIVAKFDQSMRERFGRLVEWREEIRSLAASGALLNNGFGRLMRPDPQRAHTQGPALMGQGAARDIMMTGLLRLPAEFRPMLRAQIHDEIVLSVPADQVREIGAAVVEALSFEWNGVPITADVSKAGTDWSLCYAK